MPSRVTPHVWLLPALTIANVMPVVVVSVDIPLCPSLVAVIVTWPNVSAITSPVAFTVATAVLLLAHITGAVDVLPFVYVVVAASCIC